MFPRHQKACTSTQGIEVFSSSKEYTADRYLNDCIACISSFWHFQVTASATGSQSTNMYLTIMSSWLSSLDSFTSLWEEVAEQRSQFIKFIDSSNPPKKTLIHMQLNHSLNGKEQNNALLANASVIHCWSQLHSSFHFPWSTDDL